MSFSWKYVVLIVGISSIGVLFQNCSPVAFEAASSQPSLDLISPQQNCDLNSGAPECVAQKCFFDGKSYSEGTTITAYLNSAVPSGQSCVSQERRCLNGSFSGSYAYSLCQVNQPGACLFNGQTVPHGQRVTAFQSSSVASGQSCLSESRVCNSGQLTGSFSYASCTTSGPTSCLFNGQTLPHGTSVTAYQNSTGVCAAETRVCDRGLLSGSYQFASCQTVPAAPAACLFNGQTVAHGQTVIAYAVGTVASSQSCSPQARTCQNGVLSGNYSFASCSVTAPPANKVCSYKSALEYWGHSNNQPASGCSAQIPSHEGVKPTGAQYHFLSSAPYWQGSIVFACVEEGGEAVIREISRNCTQRVRCPAGQETVSHNGVTCTYSWPEATWTGETTTIATQGGSISAFCEQTGAWSNIVKRCNGALK